MTNSIIAKRLILNSYKNSKVPDPRNKYRSHDNNQKIEKNSKPEVIGEAISAGGVDEKVSLIADGGGKTGTGTETDADNKGLGIYAQCNGGGYGNGHEKNGCGIVAQDMGTNAGQYNDSSQYKFRSHSME